MTPPITIQLQLPKRMHKLLKPMLLLLYRPCKLQPHALIQTTIEVGSLPPGANPFGVLDMGGNVRKWVQDWYKDNYQDDRPKILLAPKTGINASCAGQPGTTLWITPKLPIGWRTSLIRPDGIGFFAAGMILDVNIFPQNWSNYG